MRELIMKIKTGIVILLILALFFIFSKSGYTAINWDEFNKEPNHKILSTYPYYECFSEAEKKYSVPILLLIAVAKGESNFNSKAVSNKNAIGVMQILWPSTAKDLGFKNKEELYNPCKNIDAGARYLKSLLKRFNGDIYLSLCAYFSGPNRISNSKGKVPDYADDYAKYIYSKLASIQGISFKRKVYCTIMAYDKYFFAENIMSYITKADESITLEIKKNSMNKYLVCLSVGKHKEMETCIKKIMKITGLKLKC